MSHWLFPDFLAIPDAYAAAEQYWRDRWEEDRRIERLIEYAEYRA